MKKGVQIGSFIQNGYTLKEIRKLVPDFQPTREYFVGAGYAVSTANRYIWQLEHNEKRKRFSSNNFISSPSANFDNILVDTCALGFKNTIDVIEYAKEVTFILSTIEEMDKKNRTLKEEACSEQELYLAKNIRLYYREILLNEDKYLLSRFTGLKKEGYPDNILLQYLMILPNKIRPTLLTVDKNIAVKAASLDLDYILFVPIVPNTETISNAKPENTQSIQSDSSSDSSYSMQEFNNTSETNVETSEIKSNIEIVQCETDFSNEKPNIEIIQCETDFSDEKPNVEIVQCEPEPHYLNSSENKFITKYQHGIQVLHTQQELYLTYRGTSRLFIMYQNGKTVEYPYNSPGIQVSKGDKFSLHIKVKKSIRKYTEKIE